MRRRTPATLKHEQAAIIRVVGARLKAARELCNLSQVEAARRLGYANSSKLAKIERAVDSISIPLWLIVRASKVYEVSIDYLFGTSEDWYTDPRFDQARETSSWLFEAWEQQRKRDMQTLSRLNDQLQSVTNTTGEMLDVTEHVKEALDAFTKCNPKFTDMRGSAKLLRYVNLARDAAHHASEKLTRFRSDVRLATATTPQLDLFNEPEVD